MNTRPLLGLVAWFGVACAAVPRPGVLGDVDRARTSAQSKEAAERAPQAFLVAEKLRRDAEAAQADGDRASAELLGERALAAYERANVLARLAKAEERSATAQVRLQAVQQDAAALEEQQRRVGAEATDLEARIRVQRDALPLAPSEPSTPEREQARHAAARALSLDARLLCVATSLLSENAPNVRETFAALDAFDAELAKHPPRTPIDRAVELRSACLSLLTEARNAATIAAPEVSRPDALLDELSRGGHEPVRDDRGVVVTLHGVFRDQGITEAAAAKLLALGQVARAHPEFPVLAVVHSGRGEKAARDEARGQAVSKALREAGAAHVEARSAGSAHPTALPGRAGADARNERLEIVFVAPTQ